MNKLKEFTLEIKFYTHRKVPENMQVRLQRYHSVYNINCSTLIYRINFENIFSFAQLLLTNILLYTQEQTLYFFNLSLSLLFAMEFQALPYSSNAYNIQDMVRQKSGAYAPTQVGVRHPHPGVMPCRLPRHPLANTRFKSEVVTENQEPQNKMWTPRHPNQLRRILSPREFSKDFSTSTYCM